MGLLLALSSQACVIDRTGESQSAAFDRELRRTQQRVSTLENHFTDKLSSTSQALSNVQQDSELNQVNLANSEALVEELLTQTQAVAGSLEGLKRRVADLEETDVRVQSNLEFQLLEYDRRLTALEQRFASVSEIFGEDPGELTPGDGAGSDGGEAPKAAGGPSAEITLQRARAALAAEKPEIAVKLLEDFEKTYPDSSEIEEACFLFARALRASKRLAEAIAAYQVIVERFPESERMPEAMLSLGLTALDLGEEEEARFFLGELINIYPDASEAKEASARLKELENKSD